VTKRFRKLNQTGELLTGYKTVSKCGWKAVPEFRGTWCKAVRGISRV